MRTAIAIWLLRSRLVEGAWTHLEAALVVILPSDPVSLCEPLNEFVLDEAEGDGKRGGDKEGDVRFEIASLGCTKKVQ